MKRLKKITNDHGWTPRTLRKQEQKIKDASLRVRVTAVRLVMEGYLGKDVAKMINLCRQSVALYVARFNEGGLDHLLDRRLPPGHMPFLTEEQQQELRQLVLTTTPVDVGWGIASSWNTRMLQSYLDGEEGKAFHFIFLPPYSPHVNPIERLWKWLKDEVIANVLHKDKTTLPRRLPVLNSTPYSTQMKCYTALGVLRKEVNMLIWMYFGCILDVYSILMKSACA